MKLIFNNYLLIFILITVGFSACQTSEKTTRSELDEKIKPSSPFAVIFDTSRVFSSNLTGFALYDPVSDSMIYAHNEDRYFTPASNTKLFTFYTGLKLLPDSLRALEYVVRGDSLIFWGTGDPSFLHPELENGKVYEFLKEREEDLYYSDSNFDDEQRGPGWSWNGYNYPYQTEKSPLPIYGNTATFKMETIELKQVATTDDGSLDVSPTFFRSYIQTTDQREDDDLILFREINGNNFEYKPVADTSTYTVNKPYHYTPEIAIEMLSDTLEKSIAYLPNIEKPDSTQILYSISSDTAYKQMLQPSDNFIAEQLLLVVASELGMPLNSQSVINKMESEYLDILPQKPQWVDGSGLSRYNMFTPSSMVRLLKEIDEEFIDDQMLFHLFPAGGERGTISRWYENRGGGPPYVFAKTGTLSNNHCLSGYIITESGRKFLFSFLNNHYVTSSSVIKKEMEKVLWYIHKQY